MQRDRVEQRLQPVVGVRHLGAQRGGAVVPGGQVLAGWREPVGLVVDDGEALAGEPQHQVDAAGEVSAHALAEAWVEETLGVGVRRGSRRTPAIAASVSAGPLGSSPPTSGSSKLSSSRRSARATSRRATPPASGAEGRLDRGAEAGTTASTSPSSTRRRACAAAISADSSEERSAAAKSTDSNTRWTSVPISTPTGISASSDGTARRASSPSCGTGGASRRGLVVDDGLLRLARHVRLVGAGGDVAERRPPPPPVELAVEGGGGERRRRGHVARPGHARAERRRLDADLGRVRQLAEARQRRSSSDGTAEPDDATLPVAVAREQQPRQRRVAAAERARPPHDRLVLRARQRDVGEPQVLAALLVDVLRHVALPLRAFEADVDRPRPRGVVEGHRLASRAGSGDGSHRSG